MNIGPLFLLFSTFCSNVNISEKKIACPRSKKPTFERKNVPAFERKKIVCCQVSEMGGVEYILIVMGSVC